MPLETRNFLIAHQLALCAFADALDSLTEEAAPVSVDARKLLRVGLAHYAAGALRSEEHTSELRSLMRILSAVFCLTTRRTYTPPVLLLHEQVPRHPLLL